jgi:hypothetical protein
MKTSTTLPATFLKCAFGKLPTLAVSLLAGAACLAIGAANAAPIAQPNPSSGGGGGGGGGGGEKEGGFNEFAGRYSGTGVLSGGNPTLFGRGDAFVRKGNSGGGLTLRSTFSIGGQIAQFKRILTFKNRKLNSRSILISGGTVQAGVGRGRFTDKANLLRYKDFFVVQADGMPQTVIISGNARFFRNSARFTEVWSAPGQTVSFTYRLRPR